MEELGYDNQKKKFCIYRVMPYEGFPASKKASLMSGDKLLEINGKSVLKTKLQKKLVQF